MFSKVREDIHVIEVAVDGVQVLQERNTLTSILNISPPSNRMYVQKS